MSLKFELQNISIERLKQVSDGLNNRINTLPDEEFTAEVTAHIEAYPALSFLVELIADQAFRDGEDLEVVASISTGVSNAVFILATLADVQELPAID